MAPLLHATRRAMRAGLEEWFSDNGERVRFKADSTTAADRRAEAECTGDTRERELKGNAPIEEETISGNGPWASVAEICGICGRSRCSYCLDSLGRLRHARGLGRSSRSDRRNISLAPKMNHSWRFCSY